MIWRKKHTLPEVPEVLSFYKQAVEATDQTHQEWVVFDCETTGLSPGKDKLLSIGAVKIVDNQIEADLAFHEFVYQDNYKGEAAAVHGIGYEQVASAKPEAEVVYQFLQFVTGCPVIGHHVGFDHAMIDVAMKQHWNYPFRNLRLDTAALVREALPSHSKHKTIPNHHFSLDYLCKQLRIPIEDRHTALGDAYLTAVLFLHLKRMLTDQKLNTLFH